MICIHLTKKNKKILNDAGAARSQRNAGMHGRVATISVISLVRASKSFYFQNLSVHGAEWGRWLQIDYQTNSKHAGSTISGGKKHHVKADCTIGPKKYEPWSWATPFWFKKKKEYDIRNGTLPLNMRRRRDALTTVAPLSPWLQEKWRVTLAQEKRLACQFLTKVSRN